jgi:hypothetical protein
MIVLSGDDGDALQFGFRTGGDCRVLRRNRRNERDERRGDAIAK